MGPPSYMRSIFDRNVVMRRMTVVLLRICDFRDMILSLDWRLRKFWTSQCFHLQDPESTNTTILSNGRNHSCNGTASCPRKR